jgi:hypothetical protein
MYKLFKALQFNQRETSYYIAKDYNNSNNNHYHLFYSGWTVKVYIQTSIYTVIPKAFCLESCHNQASNNKASYEELINLIDIIVEDPSYWSKIMLEFLNLILLNWDVS